MCNSKEIIIHFIKENICTIRQNTQPQFAFGLAQAQNESDTISYRVKESCKYRRSIGNYIGRAKYGYKIIKENNISKLIKDEREQFILLLIFKLKYGSSFEKINDLVKQITKKESLIKLDNVILYGHYENEEIIHYLNEHEIYYKEYPWTPQQIYTVCKNYNNEYNKNKEKLCREFIRHLYYDCTNYNYIIKLYEKINEIQFTNELFSNIYLCLENKLTLLNFINHIYLNYNIWEMSHIENYLNNENTDIDIDNDMDIDMDIEHLQL